MRGTRSTDSEARRFEPPKAAFTQRLHKARLLPGQSVVVTLNIFTSGELVYDVAGQRICNTISADEVKANV